MTEDSEALGRAVVESCEVMMGLGIALQALRFGSEEWLVIHERLLKLAEQLAALLTG